MTFDEIRGNEDVVRALTGMVDSGKVPHAILFHEDDGGGAMPVVIAFLQYLFKENNRIPKLIHPDVHYVYPTAAGSISLQYMDRFRTLVHDNPCFSETEMGETLGIEGKNSVIAVSEAKHLLESLSLSALEGGYRAVVMYLPEKMNTEAANRLLKLIEEPPAQTQFLLVTHSPEKVLVTIASRCQRIRVRNVGASKSLASADAGLFGELMDALVARNLVAALEVGEKIAALPSREAAKTFCRTSSEILRQMFLAQQGMTSLMDAGASVGAWTSRCRRTFPRQALEAFGRALNLIDRNVNAKVLFTDLVDRLYMAI